MTFRPSRQTIPMDCPPLGAWSTRVQRDTQRVRPELRAPTFPGASRALCTRGGVLVSRAEVPAPACSLLLDLGSSLRGREDRCSFLASGAGMRRRQTRAGSGALGRRARARRSPGAGASPASIASMMWCTTWKEARTAIAYSLVWLVLVGGSAGHARRTREYRDLEGLRAGDDLE